MHKAGVGGREGEGTGSCKLLYLGANKGQQETDGEMGSTPWCVTPDSAYSSPSLFLESHLEEECLTGTGGSARML